MTHRETAILLVERLPVTRQGLANVFRDEGYRVFEASDELSAIRHIQNHQDFNVVLLDLDMPAWELIAKQARESIPAAHVLSMVGRSSIGDVGKAESMGAHRHFLKPLDFSYLHQSIQSLSATNRYATNTPTDQYPAGSPAIPRASSAERTKDTSA